MKYTVWIFAVIVLSTHSSLLQADYFWDQGFDYGNARPELPEAEGYSNSLTYISPCLFSSFCGDDPSWGAYTYLTFPDGVSVGNQYWMLHINNEPAFDNNSPFATGNPGVPGRTHPLYYSTDANWTYYPESFDVVTDTAIGEYFPRAHLIVRHFGETDSHDGNGELGLPFISVGAQEDAGTFYPVGEIYGSPHKVKFKAKIWDYVEPSGGEYYSDGGLWFYMFALSEWGGKKRGVFLTLKHLGDYTDQSTSSIAGVNFPWNWPISESVFYPGVDWAFIDSEDLNSGPSSWHCDFSVPSMTSTGTDYQFYVDLEKLFECASDRGLFGTPIPSSSQGVLDITGVHWANEMNGISGGLWTSVHDMEMY